MKGHKCPKCGAQMQEGYIIDEQRPSRWISGSPQRSLMDVLRLRRRQRRHIESHRCVDCGFIELYAEAVVA